jgi:sec-independent protein translocase protein TatC
MTESDPFEHTRMTLGEHLEELRGRLFKGVIALLIAFAGAWYFRDAISLLVSRPYFEAMGMLQEYWIEAAEKLLTDNPERLRTELFLSADPSDQRLLGFSLRMNAIGMGETFLYQLKICLYFAVFIGAPVLLWQMWQFVGAGLYPTERKPLLRYFPVSVAMFVGGVLFGFFVMVPYGMYFLNRSAPLDLALPQITTQNYLTFLSSLCLAFGVIFQLPLVMTFLGGAGILSPRVMSKYRGHFIVGAFVVAAMLTPPDPVTQLMMGVPLIVLFEVGVLGARIVSRGKHSTDLEVTS